MVSFRMPRKLLEELDRLVEQIGLSRSEVIRDAVSSYIKTKSGGVSG